MRNLKWELQKSPINIWLLLLILIGMLLVNGFVATKKIHRNTAAITDDYRRGLNNVYSIVEGSITLEKMNWIISEHNRLDNIIQKGQFSTEKDEENTYTGYVFSDNALFEQIYEETKYAFNYEIEAQEIVSVAMENVVYYQNRSNESKAAYYSAMADAFKNRGISDFYRTEGWMSYLEYEFSNLMVLLAIMIELSTTFSLEWELGTKSIMCVISGGVHKCRRDKLLFTMLFVFLITSCFSIQDYLIFADQYSLQGLNNPLYAIPEMRETPLNISIGLFLLLNFLAKLLGMWFFSLQLLLLSMLMKCNLYAFSSSVMVLAIHILLNAMGSDISVLSLFNSVQLCSEFKGIAIANYFVPYIFSPIVIQFIIACCCWLLLCIVDRDKTLHIRKDTCHGSAYSMPN